MAEPTTQPESKQEGSGRVQQAFDQVAYLAVQGIFTDCGHHRQWFLDQVLRVLLGDQYDLMVSEQCTDENGTPNAYEWGAGITP